MGKKAGKHMATQLTTTRAERGQAIAKLNGQVKRLNDCTYTVKSQSGNGEYTVSKKGDEWVCSCPDNTHRHVFCKHIYAVDLSSELRNKVSENRVIQEIVGKPASIAVRVTSRRTAYAKTRAEQSRNSFAETATTTLP